MQTASCVNHSWAAASATCPDCGQPYCDQCLVEFLGQRYCGPCRDRRLAAMQGVAAPSVTPLYAGTGKVDLGRWIGQGWELIRGDLLTFALATFLWVALSILTCGILTGPLWCGLYMMVYRKMTGHPVAVGDLFLGFRRFLWAFLTLVLYVAIAWALQFALLLPFTLGARGEEAPVVGQILSTLAALVFAGATFFAFPHVAARNVNPVDAFVASWGVFRRNPLGFVLAAFLLQLLGGVGVLACLVGVFVTQPLMIAAVAQAYADHFGVTEVP